MAVIAKLLSGLFLLTVLTLTTAHADTSDFGGYPERFKGKGDRVPPECQFDSPRTAAEPFFVKWHCSDDYTAEEDIRSELWILRGKDNAPQKVTEFIGFPASVFIDEPILQQPTFTDGLPVSFRLIATDKAGNAVITPYISVEAQGEVATKCAVTVTTEGTESTGNTTGVPSLTVSAQNANIAVVRNSNGSFRISTLAAVSATTCEIESLCEDNSMITFEGSFTGVTTTTTDSEESGASSAAQQVTGTLSFEPSDVEATVTGQAQLEDSSLKSLNVTGSTTISGAAATVTLTCEP